MVCVLSVWVWSFIVLPTKFELVRRIACPADNQRTTLLFAQINIVGVAGSRGSGSKFIVASISFGFGTRPVRGIGL
jgi:hypothetical protein